MVGINWESTVTIADLREALTAGPGRPPLDADELRAAGAAPHLAGLIDELRTEAARRASRLPALTWSQYRRYADTGDRLRYERAYFDRRGRVNALAAVTVIDDDARAGRALADVLWSVCDEYTWALPAHAGLVAQTPAGGPQRELPQCVDLFACETAHLLAEVVTLLGERLPAPVRQRVHTEVHRRVLAPYFGDPRLWPWESYRNNWAAVCAGAAGMAALALWRGTGAAQADRLAPALHRCLAAMATFRSGLGADGGCAEGVNYWIYGFGYYCYFAEALRARTGLDLLGQTPAALAAFPAGVQLGAGRFVTFSDATGSPSLPSGLLSRLRERLHAPVPAGLAVPGRTDDWCHRWAQLSRTLAWTDPADLGGGGPGAGGCWLDDLAWLVDRRVGAGGLPVAFAAKGGHNDEPHNHNDLGHFILAAGGEQLLVDLGAGEYRADYFGADRYQQLHPSAQGHSVPVVDGHPQRAGREAAAAVLGVDRGEHGADLALDLSAAYQGGAQVWREFRWRAPGGAGATLRITDRFTGAAEVDELFISRLCPELGEGTARWRGAAAIAVLRYDPALWSPAVERIDTRDHRGAPEVVYRLRLRSRVPPGTAEFEIHLPDPAI